MFASGVKNTVKFSTEARRSLIRASKNKIGLRLKSTSSEGPIADFQKSGQYNWRLNAFGITVGVAAVLGTTIFANGDGSSSSGSIIQNDAAVSSNTIITLEELKKHNRLDDCWVAIHGKVYDVTEFLSLHPGGANRILRYAGGDATKGFSSMHAPTIISRQLGPDACLGDVEVVPVEKKKSVKKNKKKKKTIEESDEEKEMTKSSKKKSKRSIIYIDEEETDDTSLAQRRRQKFIDSKPPLTMIFNLADFEAVAQKILDPVSYNYFSTGSSDEFTLRENHYAFSRVFFRPRVGIDVSNGTISSTILGYPTEAPIFISSFAGSHLCDKAAELNLVRGAGKEKIPYIIPIHASMPVEDLAAASVSPDQTLFYQLDFYTRDQINKTPQIFKKLETQMPNIKGVFINVDLATAGSRERDSKIRAVTESEYTQELNDLISDDTSYATLTWDDFKAFKQQTKLPIVVKGVQSSQDILIAAKLGLNGATISNHGGRQLDFSRPPLEVLAESKKLLKENGLDQGFELYIDGGIKRGSDVLKAISLGATAVGLGRPFLYAMSGYGEEGVVKTIRLLKGQMARDMKLLGAPSMGVLDETFVDTESLSIKGVRILDGQYKSNYVAMPPPYFGTAKA